MPNNPSGMAMIASTTFTQDEGLTRQEMLYRQHGGAPRGGDSKYGDRLRGGFCHQKLGSRWVSESSRMKERCPKSPAANSARTRRKK